MMQQEETHRKHPSFPIKAESGTHTKKATFLESNHGCFLRASFCCIINGSHCMYGNVSIIPTGIWLPFWKFHNLGQVKQQVRWCIIFRGALLCNFILKNYLIFPSWRFYFHIRPASDIKFWKQNHGLLFLFFSLNLLFYQLDSPNTKKLKKQKLNTF